MSALVRVMVPFSTGTSQDAATIASDFARLVYPNLKDFLP